MHSCSSGNSSVVASTSSATGDMPSALSTTTAPASVVALLVLATTLLFPLLQLCILFYLLVPMRYERRPAGFGVLVNALVALRPWGMIEVFLLGVLVAIIKLSSLAQVIAGPALWAFVGLTVLLTAVLSFNPRTFWEMAFEPRPGQEG